LINILNLGGCAPVPLAHYLKALGILRLVAEQKDFQARGWWENESFRLVTSLSHEDLEKFFLERYEPTPFVSPWNKGSGFFAASEPALAPLEGSLAPRFARFRSGIAASRAMLKELAQADQAVRLVKDETKAKGLSRAKKEAIRGSPDYKKRLADAGRLFARSKTDLIPKLRLEWRGPHREWMDAAMVLDADGKPAFPALLGTGGNDGRLDFTNNFMQRLADVYDFRSGSALPAAGKWIVGALWGEPIPGCKNGCAVGQYLPGSAGGANNSNGPEADSILNPMDFLLMMEGAVLFTGNATRRMSATEPARAAAPFSVSAQSAGYASSGNSDESARGEQWMPLWNRPISLSEFRRLLSEGRAQIGTRPARRSIDLARSIAMLGAARGIASFQRYGYIERNGQSNLAVPLGRFVVPDRASPRLACLDDLDSWLPRIHRLANAKDAPARFALAERRLTGTLFAVAQHPEQPTRWQEVLLALASVEGIQKAGSGFAAGPVPRLRPEWVAAADDTSPELRLALSLALQQAGYRGEKSEWWNTTRRHWLPLDSKKPSQFAKSGTGHQARLQVGAEVVMHGRQGLDDAIALVERRLTEANQRGERRLTLLPARTAGAQPGDLAALISGEVYIDRTVALSRALMALDPRKWAKLPAGTALKADDRYPDDAWIVLRLALLPWPLKRKNGEVRIGMDPAIFRRLAAGDAATAVQIGLRRLSAAGVRTAVRATTVSREIARLWAAALAFPITETTARGFLRRLDPSIIDKEAIL
jgi:CRISPR-associated protein Csx17